MMRFQTILFFILGLSLPGTVAFAECTSQFGGVGGAPTIVAADNYVDIEKGLGRVMLTSSVSDFRGESSCTNVMNQLVRLPFYGRLAAVELFGYAKVLGENTYGRFEIKGRASVANHADTFHKNFQWSGVPGIVTMENDTRMFAQEREANSVCGEAINVQVDLMRLAFEKDPTTSGDVQIFAEKVRLRFEPMAANDGNCINRPASVAPSLPIPFGNGQRVEIVSAQSHKCVDIGEYAVWNGAPANQWDCAQSPNQLFRVNVSGDSMTLAATHSNQCLAIGNGSQANGAATTQTVDCQSAAAKIKLGPASTGGAFTLRSANSGKCLDIDSGKLDNGQKLQQWDCVGTLWQEWWINVR